MSETLVTIAIPTYNRASGYLREALGSALAQTYEPLEIVVVDNASTDDTGAYVASVADERVRYVRNESNVGVNDNFNACVRLARGEYVLLLHDDDHIDPDFVRICMGALSEWEHADPPGFIRTGTRGMDASGAVTRERRNAAGSASVGDLALSWFRGRTSIFYCSTLFRTEALRATGGFHSRRELYTDVAAIVRIAAEYRVLNIEDVLASFRRHGGNNGNVQTIEAWCDDSLYVLDLMCEKAPEQAARVRSEGLRFFTRNNYYRVLRLNGLWTRVQGYWFVYRFFGFRTSPLRLAAQRGLRWVRANFGGVAVGS